MTSRGIQRVHQVIAHLETIDRMKGDGLTPEAIAALRLPEGRSLPPSLQCVLGWDATYFAHLLDDTGALELFDFADMLEFAFGTSAGFEMFERLLEGTCLLLEKSREMLWFMYVGERDKFGEYPVFVVDKSDDERRVCLQYPGLDVYLFEEIDEDFVESEYEKDVRAQAKQNFHKFISIGISDEDGYHSGHYDSLIEIEPERIGGRPAHRVLDKLLGNEQIAWD